jgi:hypothetical protein
MEETRKVETARVDQFLTDNTGVESNDTKQ